ncbi:hypothetical protein D4764_17G0001220 [Takifugu flavidus]|uniref:Uncharacterized protein n=1 Tax=Takifugu flavidus TaxID=433684 RepID=A0A5C6NVJ2_9TELE|nr:hypothetical protein D4764_17G0001220 [Takifugu flavidus]
MYPKSQRRSPGFSDDPYMHYNHSNQEELYHRQPPPHYDTVGFEDHRRPSPLHNREDREGHRDGFREHSKGFNNWERSPKSPLRIHGEEFSSTYRPKEAKMGKRREEQGGSWKKCRDASPRASSRTETWDAGWGRGRRNCQSSNRERPRDESHRERSPVFKRQRGLEEDEDPHGYRNKAFEEQRYAARDTFGRDARASSGPIIIEHDHGFRPHRKLSRGRSSERQDHGSDGGRPRGAHQAERYRMSGDRLDLWEDASGRRDDGRAFRYPDPRRNPAHHGTPNAGMLGKQKGKSGFQGRAQGGRAGPHGIQPRMPESSHGFPDVPQQEQSSEGQAFTEDHYKNPNSAEAERHEDGRAQPWMSRRSRSLEPSPPAIDLDPKMPRQRMLERNRAKPKNVTVVAEETMTIKVDMKRPVSKDR